MAMAEINRIVRKYRKPFVLTKTKLARICEIVNKRFTDLSKEEVFDLNFEVVLEKGKKHSIHSLESLFNMDNSMSNRIKELSIEWEMGKEDDRAYTVVAVDYDSNPHPMTGTSIFLSGKSPNFTWLNEMFAELEEQIDRTVPVGYMYRLKSLPYLYKLLIFMASFTLILGLISSFQSLSESKGAFQIAERDRALILQKAKDTNTTDEKINIIFDVITSSLMHCETDSRFWGYLKDAKTYFLLSPVVLVIFMFFYLYIRCYPSYVFEWGDIETYHLKLIERRKYLWSVIVGSLLVGILANLFVYGLSDVFRNSK